MRPHRRTAGGGPDGRRPRSRPPAGAFGKLLSIELKLAWRMPVSLVFGLGLPIMLLGDLWQRAQVQHPSRATGRGHHHEPVRARAQRIRGGYHGHGGRRCHLGQLPRAGGSAAYVHHAGPSLVGLGGAADHQPGHRRHGSAHNQPWQHDAGRTGTEAGLGVHTGPGLGRRGSVGHRTLDRRGGADHPDGQRHRPAALLSADVLRGSATFRANSCPTCCVT